MLLVGNCFLVKVQVVCTRGLSNCVKDMKRYITMLYIQDILHLYIWLLSSTDFSLVIFRLDALALSVIATATWLGGWLGGCLSQPVLYQND